MSITELLFSRDTSLMLVKSVKFAALEMDFLSPASKCCFKSSTIKKKKKIPGNQIAPVLDVMDKPLVIEDI